jgi:3,4-dihydroxy 2-butanone 4-phosphate synthase/GTP cyclohydrolase II
VDEELAGVLPANAAAHRERTDRPLVTVSYAQTLDGCLALRQGEPAPISGEASMRLTHRLRAAHHAILVGIGTVLADDPHLTVRLADGQNPQPIVVDSNLRFPVGARLTTHPCGAWIATTEAGDDTRRATLEEAGARLLVLPAHGDGHIDLRALLVHLGELGIDSLMVEGGAALITSFLRLKLADRAVITIAPSFAGGYHAVQPLKIDHWNHLPRLHAMQAAPVGDDLVVWGNLR